MADPTCRLCNNGSAQTNKHVLSNCSAQVALKRYTKRHNDVLQLLADWLLSNRSKDYSLHADIESNKFKRVAEVFDNRVRPDIILVDFHRIIVPRDKFM